MIYTIDNIATINDVPEGADPAPRLLNLAQAKGKPLEEFEAHSIQNGFRFSWSGEDKNFFILHCSPQEAKAQLSQQEYQQLELE